MVKSGNPSVDSTTSFKIAWVVMTSDHPMRLEEICKATNLRRNLVFYHLKVLKDKRVILETEDKEYYCQPLFWDKNIYEDLDALIMMMIKIIARELEMENDADEEKLSKAVLENLKIYIQAFELEVQ